MEGDDAYMSPGLKPVGRTFQRIAQNAEFVIDFDADGLKGPLGRMRAVLSGAGWNSLFNNRDELASPFNGLFFAGGNDKGGNALGPAFFAVRYNSPSLYELTTS